MSKRKFTRREWLLFLTPVLVFAIPWLLSVSRQKWSPSWRLDYPREKERLSSCQSNLKQLQIAAIQYVADYDGRFPPVNGKPGALGIVASPRREDKSFSGDSRGWTESLRIYFYSDTLYKCPSDYNNLSPATLKKVEMGYTDYWFNSNLSTLPKKKIATPASTFFVGEGNDGTDVADRTYNKTSIPPLWLTDKTSPAYRHLGGANYLMADGSVHWLRPEQLANFGGRKNPFSVK